MAWPGRIRAGDTCIAGFRAASCHRRIAMLQMGLIGFRRQAEDHAVMANRLVGLLRRLNAKIGRRQKVIRRERTLIA